MEQLLGNLAALQTYDIGDRPAIQPGVHLSA